MSRHDILGEIEEKVRERYFQDVDVLRQRVYMGVQGGPQMGGHDFFIFVPSASIFREIFDLSVYFSGNFTLRLHFSTNFSVIVHFEGKF